MLHLPATLPRQTNYLTSPARRRRDADVVAGKRKGGKIERFGSATTHEFTNNFKLNHSLCTPKRQSRIPKSVLPPCRCNNGHQHVSARICQRARPVCWVRRVALIIVPSKNRKLDSETDSEIKNGTGRNRNTGIIIESVAGIEIRTSTVIGIGDEIGLGLTARWVRTKDEKNNSRYKRAKPSECDKNRFDTRTVAHSAREKREMRKPFIQKGDITSSQSENKNYFEKVHSHRVVLVR
ncbi:hypothetical protein EVAR_66311_1 [Eumeta japonica]|uniref:Uncharacterized protein n=1 Tax=Eumeta variegata TaxID=151549 RepID=A0A4C1ZRK2_EUMVA|nr:hypothetical protein EVAR_66311_1 [Eumeta japonica]